MPRLKKAIYVHSKLALACPNCKNMYKHYLFKCIFLLQYYGIPFDGFRYLYYHTHYEIYLTFIPFVFEKVRNCGTHSGPEGVPHFVSF